MSLGGKGFSSSAEAVTAACEVSFAENAVNFASRFQDALRRRLHPNTTLHIKQLAHAIGKSPRSVQMVMAGEIGANGATVAACIQFFWHTGDRGFAAEIFALPVQAMLSAEELQREKETFARDLFERALPRLAAGGDRFKLVWPPAYRIVAVQAA